MKKSFNDFLIEQLEAKMKRARGARKAHYQVMLLDARLQRISQIASELITKDLFS